MTNSGYIDNGVLYSNYKEYLTCKEKELPGQIHALIVSKLSQRDLGHLRFEISANMDYDPLGTMFNIKTSVWINGKEFSVDDVIYTKGCLDGKIAQRDVKTIADTILVKLANMMPFMAVTALTLGNCADIDWTKLSEYAKHSR